MEKSWLSPKDGGNSNHEGAVFLADASLAASIVVFRNGDEGVISFGESRAHFSKPSLMRESQDWEFYTIIPSTASGLNSISAYGVDSGTEIGTTASRTFSTKTINSLYAFAIFSDNTCDALEVGDTGSGADIVNGDGYWNIGEAFIDTHRMTLYLSQPNAFDQYCAPLLLTGFSQAHQRL